MHPHLDLHEVKHPDCRQCRRAERDDIDADGLCTSIVSLKDGLPLRCVGEWAHDKIYRLIQYFGIFAGGMRNRWAGLNYIEVCSGPGRCISRETREEMDGTALAILHHQHFHLIKRAAFIDASPRVVAVLNQRIQNLGKAKTAQALVGNYHKPDTICQILEALPANCLNLVFIDPTECDVPFATIERVVQPLENADLLINVALGTDVTRNIIPAILSPASHRAAREKYESFLGTPGFCSQPDIIELAERSDHDDLRRLFAEAYQARLRGLGYVHTAVKPVRHYYHLLFASRNHKGLEFWEKSCRHDPSGQKQLL